VGTRGMAAYARRCDVLAGFGVLCDKSCAITGEGEGASAKAS